jgi:predicted DNA-binding transcriptional regulator AlpA
MLASRRLYAAPLRETFEVLMADKAATLPNRYLRTQEAARFLGLSQRTLEKHRTYGTGPTFRKLGGRVVYSVDELQAWADRGVATSTSDPRARTVPPAKPHAATVGLRDRA